MQGALGESDRQASRDSIGSSGGEVISFFEAQLPSVGEVVAVEVWPQLVLRQMTPKP